MTDNPNVVMIVLDTVRAANISCYGHHRETTPFLDSVDAVRFENAFSPAQATIPSHASMFTGSYPSIHGTTFDNKRLNPRAKTLAEILREEGYQTMGFSNNIHISPHLEFDRGFDRFTFNKDAYGEPFGGVPTQHIRQGIDNTNPKHQRILEVLEYVREQDGSIAKTSASWLYKKATEAGLIERGDRGAQRTLETTTEWLGDNDNDPFFMFINMMEGHMPFLAPDEYIDRYDPEIDRNVWGDYEGLHTGDVDNEAEIVDGLIAQYDGCIAYLDAILSKFIDQLRSESVLENSYVFILGDHGEAFGEHGIYGHSGGVYNPITKVPLLMLPPGEENGRTVSDPVSTQWIMPTILETIGVQKPDQCVDRTLHAPSGPVITESSPLGVDVSHPRIDRYKQSMQACIQNGRKLVEAESWSEMYDLEETEEITGEEASIESLRDTLEAEIGSYDPIERSARYSDNELSGEAQQQLKTLGYID